LATTTRKKTRISVKEMKFRNDPMIRFYDKTQDWLQERGKPYIRAATIALALLLVYTAGYYYFEYRESKAASEFAEAWKLYNAPVVESPVGQVGKYYTDDKVKWQETAEAFERLAAKESGYYGVMGRYFAGTAYLRFDAPKGLQVLQEVVSTNEQPTSDLAKLALAEYYAGSGDNENSLKLYEELLGSAHAPKQVVHLGLGKAYEKGGNNEKAIESYFEAAKLERTNAAGAEAEKRLSALAPERVRELPVPNPISDLN
jgi:tetratricopeptide (TPR) repeat protein